MKVVGVTGNPDVALVYLVEPEDGKIVECVEAVQPPIPRIDKWVLMISTLYGCPVNCKICDAGGSYQGKVSANAMLAQIDLLVDSRYEGRVVPCKQFKIQFARMGDPAFNDQVLDVLEILPHRYHAPGLMPSLSTIAPHGRDAFFERLIDIKNTYYRNGAFQFQFSIHTTDIALRDELIPVRKWDFSRMAMFAERFVKDGDRKITLNFALGKGMPVDASVLRDHFSPELFLIKITPVNPTYSAVEHGIESYINPLEPVEKYELVDNLCQAGYQVIVSIGELEENYIGSNCGQYVRRHLSGKDKIANAYTYQLIDKRQVKGMHVYR